MRTSKLRSTFSSNSNLSRRKSKRSTRRTRRTRRDTLMTERKTKTKVLPSKTMERVTMTSYNSTSMSLMSRSVSS